MDKQIKKCPICGEPYYIYDITLDIHIPTYFVVSIGASSIGQIFCVGMASHLDGEKALLKALIESAQGRPYLRYEFFSEPNWSFRDDFEDINFFRDHARVYTRRPDLIKYLGFCTSYNGNYAETIPDLSTGNLENDVQKVISFLKQRNLEPLVVDLTTPDIEKVGLSVVRVLVPGLQPLHGDHRYPFLGNNRIYTIPKKIGFRKEITNEQDLFSFPHPSA